MSTNAIRNLYLHARGVQVAFVCEIIVSRCPFLCLSAADLAPEMFGECHERAADVWSLGLCIWEGLKGSHPIAISDPQEQTEPQPVEFVFENFISLEARDLIRKVCVLRGVRYLTARHGTIR